MSRHLNAVQELKGEVSEVAYAFDRYYLNPAERLLLRDGKPLELRPKLFETLVILVSNAGRLLTKSQLLNALWPNTFVDEAGIARNICSLRDILHDHGHCPRFIETVPKFGYRFVGEVSPILEQRSNLQIEAIGAFQFREPNSSQ